MDAPKFKRWFGGLVAFWKKNSQNFRIIGASNPIGSMYGIFTYIYHQNQPDVGKYTSPMDPMGIKDSPLLMGVFLKKYLGWEKNRKIQIKSLSSPPAQVGTGSSALAGWCVGSTQGPWR